MRPLLAVLLVLISPPPTRAEATWEPRAQLEFGVDSFAQIYRLTDLADGSLLGDENTLRTETDVFTELRAAAELGLRLGDTRETADLRTRLSYGTDTLRGIGAARFDLRGAGQRLDGQVEVEGRRFRDDTDFTLSSDFGEFRTRAHWQRTVTDRWDLGLRVRGRATRYERPSAFELDHERLDLSITSETRGGLGRWFDVELGMGRQWADAFEDPDPAPGDPTVVSILTYDRLFGSVEWIHDDGDRWRVSLAHFVERRDYEDQEQRSSLWDVVIEPEVRLRLDPDWELRWRSGIEWLDYDTSSETYYDLALGRTGIGLARRWRTFEWSVEPRLTWLSTPRANEDEYVQPSLALTFDGFGGERFFVSITEEVGHRDYREPTTGALDLYSDYWFLRSTILASVKLVRGTSLDVFVSDEPESHRDEEDDTRLTLVTATLRVRF